MKLFYDHLISLDDLYEELLQIETLAHEERMRLHRIIDRTMHHQVINEVLNHLPKSSHESFILELKHRPDDQALLDLVKPHQSEIERLIQAKAEELKREFRVIIKAHGPSDLDGLDKAMLERREGAKE